MGAGGADVGALGYWFFKGRRSRGFGKDATAAEEEFLQRAQGMSPEERQQAALEFEDQIGALARKRGLQAYGLDDDESYLKEFRDREALRLRRAAGAMAAQGDVGGAYNTLGGGELRAGNLETGLPLQRRGAQIQNLQQATQGGGYDEAGYLGAERKASGQYGDEQGVSQRTGQMVQLAQQLYGKAYTMLGMGAKDEEIAGLITHAAEMDHRWGSDVGVAFDPQAKKYWPTRGGKPLGEGFSREELGQYLQTLVSDPDKLLTASRDAAIADAQATRGAQRERGQKGFEALMKIFTDPGQQSAASALFTAKGSLKQQGWQLYNTPQQLADGSTVQMAQKDGQLFQLKRFADDADSPFAGQMQVLDGNGNPVDPTKLPGGTVLGQYMDVATQARTIFSLEQQDRLFRANAIEDLLGGNSPSAGAMGRSRDGGSVDPQQVQAALDDMGKQFGFATTSTTRSAAENKAAHGVANSQHMSGTARDFSVKGKTREEIDQFASALAAAGFEVIDETDGRTGTGPHLHVELPPGATSVSAMGPATGGAGGMGDAAPAPKAKGALPARGKATAATEDLEQGAQDVTGQVSALRAKQEELRQAQAVYERFNRDYPEPQAPTSAMAAKTGDYGTQEDPEVAQARAEITGRLRQLTAELRDLSRTVTQRTNEVRGATTKTKARALAARYTTPAGAAGSQ